MQLIYRTDHETGKLLVAHPLVAATGYTGSRSAGLTLKEAADKAGKPIYLELSSINPVVMLPGALRTPGRRELADEFTGSCLMGTGQFCTNPGLVLLLAGPETDAFIEQVREQVRRRRRWARCWASRCRTGWSTPWSVLTKAGAEVLIGGQRRAAGAATASTTPCCAPTAPAS